MTAIFPAPQEIDFDVASRSLGGSERRLASEAEVSEVGLGFEAGALLPFDSQYGVITIIDSPRAKADEILFEGSTHHETIRVKFADFS